MEDLLALVEILNGFRIPQIEVVGNVTHADTRYQELYRMMTEQPDLSREEIAERFGVQVGEKSERRLFGEMKSRLMTTMIVSEIGSFSKDSYQAKFYRVSKQYAHIIMLNALGRQKIAAEEAVRIYKEAVAMDFTEAIIKFDQLIIGYNGVHEYNPKIVEQHQRSLERQFKIYRVESYLRMHGMGILGKFQRKKVAKPELVEQVDTVLDGIPELPDDIDTTNYMTFYYLLKLIRTMCVHDYVHTIEVCQEAIVRLQKKRYVPGNPIITFYHNIIASQLYLKRYEAAAQTFVASQPYADRAGAFNRLKHEEMKTSFFLHTGRFGEAVTTYQEVARTRIFKSQTSHHRERWELLAGWVHLAQQLYGVLPEQPVPFRLARFLNSIPTFSMDKSGMNIQVLLLKVAFLLWRDDTDHLIDLEEGIRKYIQRYVQVEENFRSRKMLALYQVLVENDYDAPATRAQTTHLLAELSSQPPNQLDDAHDVEIVPYEMVWRFLLETAEYGK